MNTILSPDPQLTAFDDEKLLKLLAHTSGPIRARAIPTLGPRAAQAPPLMEVLFDAAADPTNLTLVFYAFIKVAWVAAITILDYGTDNDLVRLQKVVQAWPQAEQQGFLAYVKDYRNFDKLFAEKLLEANYSKRRQKLPEIQSDNAQNNRALINYNELDTKHHMVELTEHTEPVHVRFSKLTSSGQRNKQLRHRRSHNTSSTALRGNAGS